MEISTSSIIADAVTSSNARPEILFDFPLASRSDFIMSDLREQMQDRDGFGESKRAVIKKLTWRCLALLLIRTRATDARTDA